MSTEMICLIICTAVLAILLLIFVGKYYALRSEQRQFRQQLQEIRTTNREQPIRVASFGASSVELATEINLLLKELRAAAQRSADEEKRIRTIMAGVSHDFRTPLTAADGYLQLAEDIIDRPGTVSGKQEIDRPGTVSSKQGTGTSLPGTVPEFTGQELIELRDYLRIVSERVKYLRALSDEFFEVTYLDAKKEIPLSEVRLDTLLSEVLLAQHQWIEEENIDVDISIPEEKMTVTGDRHYLERILENLFSNARKYAKSILSVSAEVQKDSICLIIKNDLQDMQELDPKHIFEPFYRAKGRSGPGTGLGLYVCKELADAMHFKIEGNTSANMFELKLEMPSQLPS